MAPLVPATQPELAGAARRFLLGILFGGLITLVRVGRGGSPGCSQQGGPPGEMRQVRAAGQGVEDAGPGRRGTPSTTVPYARRP